MSAVAIIKEEATCMESEDWLKDLTPDQRGFICDTLYRMAVDLARNRARAMGLAGPDISASTGKSTAWVSQIQTHLNKKGTSFMEYSTAMGYFPSYWIARAEGLLTMDIERSGGLEAYLRIHHPPQE